MVPFTGGVRALRCPDCGTNLPRTFTYTATERDFGPHRNTTPLRVGMKGTFFGREYELIGRVVLSMQEEGQTYYWDEFELVSADGHILYLEFDEGSWKLMEPFQPSIGLLPSGASERLHVGAMLPLEGAQVMVKEVAQKRIEFIQGQLTYEANVGDTGMYADAQRLNRHFSIEWTPDEIEFYHGRPMAEREVFGAFGLKQAIDALDHRAVQSRSQNLFAGVCLILSLFSFALYGIALASGTNVSANSAPIDSIGPDGMRFGPINLDPGKHVHRLVINGTMTEASAWVAGVLETAEGAELIGSQGDFWDESGSDSDGYWHESDLWAQTDFAVRSPGPYYIRLYTEKDTPIGATGYGGTTASYGSAGYTLKAGAMYPNYFLTFGLVMLPISIIFFCIGSREALAKASQNAD
jgi:hypothetical protein